MMNEKRNIGRMPKIVKPGSKNEGRFAKVISYNDANDMYTVQFKDGKYGTYASEYLVFNDKIENGQYVILESTYFTRLVKLIEQDEDTILVLMDGLYEQEFDRRTEVINMSKVMPADQFTIKVGDFYLAKDAYRTLSLVKLENENTHFSFAEISELVPDLATRARLVEWEFDINEDNIDKEDEYDDED
mgnify:CR=1 FL=1